MPVTEFWMAMRHSSCFCWHLYFLPIHHYHHRLLQFALVTWRTRNMSPKLYQQRETRTWTWKQREWESGMFYALISIHKQKPGQHCDRNIQKLEFTGAQDYSGAKVLKEIREVDELLSKAVLLVRDKLKDAHLQKQFFEKIDAKLQVLLFPCSNILTTFFSALCNVAYQSVYWRGTGMPCQFQDQPHVLLAWPLYWVHQKFWRHLQLALVLTKFDCRISSTHLSFKFKLHHHCIKHWKMSRPKFLTKSHQCDWGTVCCKSTPTKKVDTDRRDFTCQIKLTKKWVFSGQEIPLPAGEIDIDIPIAQIRGASFSIILKIFSVEPKENCSVFAWREPRPLARFSVLRQTRDKSERPTWSEKEFAPLQKNHVLGVLVRASAGQSLSNPHSSWQYLSIWTPVFQVFLSTNHDSDRIAVKSGQNELKFPRKKLRHFFGNQSHQTAPKRNRRSVSTLSVVSFFPPY